MHKNWFLTCFLWSCCCIYDYNSYDMLSQRPKAQ